MKKIFWIIILILFSFGLKAQDKELSKKIKSAAKYLENVANYNEEMLENIKKAQNAANISDMKFYTEQALNQAETMESNNQYANDDLLEIFDLAEKKGLNEIRTLAAKTDGHCLMVKTYCFDINMALNSAMISENMMEISSKLGTARISSEVIIKEMNLAIAESDQLKVLINPEISE